MTRPPAPLPARAVRRRTRAAGLVPLIDLVFILLVFFMLVSSFRDWRAIGLAVPGAAEAASGPVLVIALEPGRRGAATLDGRPVPDGGLAARVAARLAARPGLPVRIEAGEGVPFARTVRALEAVGAAGGRDVSLSRGAAP